MNGVVLYGEPGLQSGVVAIPSNPKQQQQHPSGASANVNGWNNEYNDKQWERNIRHERKLERKCFHEREVRE